jgi:hypothetical protein
LERKFVGSWEKQIPIHQPDGAYAPVEPARLYRVAIDYWVAQSS